MEGLEEVEVQFELEGADIERLVVVGGDLEYLIRMPRDRLPTHTEVRLAAGILRRLFIDDGHGQIGKLFQSMKGPPDAALAVKCIYLDAALAAWEPKWIRYAWAGGGTYREAHHAGFLLAVIPQAIHKSYGGTEAFLRANPLPMKGTPRLLTIEQWLSSTAMAVSTNELGLVRISRARIVQYVANRKGGVHFDPSRRLELGKANKRYLEQQYHLLDHGLLRIGHLSGPEFEVASMAQSVANAGWAIELARLSQEEAPAEFVGDPLELRFWTGQVEADGTPWATTRFTPDTSSEQ